MRAFDLRLAAFLIMTVLAGVSYGHPGAAIAVSKDGIVYFVDTGAGVFSIEAGGKVVRREGPAFHWFAFDPASRFRKTPWPSMPNAEFRSAGLNPTVVLSSDFPVTIGADGKFYYPDGSSGALIRIVGIEPSGARSIRATLPPIRRAGQTITWLNGLTPGTDGSLYYTEDRAIRKVDPRGQVSAVAVNVVVPGCTAVPGYDAGVGPYLRGLAIAADGSIYVAASGCGALLRVDARGNVTTVLKAEAPWSPTAVAVAGRDVYVLEYLHTASDNRGEWLPRVRKISQSGKVTLLGGIIRKAEHEESSEAIGHDQPTTRCRRDRNTRVDGGDRKGGDGRRSPARRGTPRRGSAAIRSPPAPGAIGTVHIPLLRRDSADAISLVIDALRNPGSVQQLL